MTAGVTHTKSWTRPPQGRIVPSPARTIHTYRDLTVWQRALDLVVIAYRVSKRLPKDELYGLVSQIRRAATSIPANIAEGQGRRFTREFLHFLGIARGSLLELETHILASQRLGFLNDSDVNDCLGVAAEVSRMLAGLKRSLESRMPRGRLDQPHATRHSSP
jgi:four helix bundle protein